MQTEIVFAGFGGQGVLFAGELLAYAALDRGRQVTWIPSYGPEMRGGTAHCIVIISDEEIGSPIVRNPQAAVVMNLPSLEKYEPLVKSGGVLIINGSMVDREPTRTDIQCVQLPAVEIAEELGDRRLANIVLVGALLERLPVLTHNDVIESLKQHLPERKRALLEPNFRALERGAQLARGEAVSA